MKCLTLTQPWASLVAIGAKSIETRSWKTNYRGRLYIHAAKGFPKAARELCAIEPFKSRLSAGGFSFASQLPTSAVIAVCELVDCIPIRAELQIDEPEFSFGDYTPGRWAWKLRNVEPVVHATARGSLGLWEWKGTA